MDRRLGSWLAALCLFGLLGCTNPIRRGSALYAEGRLVEAAEVFEHAEPRLLRHNARERAEFGLYRGLTMLELGDGVRARFWFRYAIEIDRTHPKALDPHERSLLRRGWWELEQKLHQDPPPTGG